MVLASYVENVLLWYCYGVILQLFLGFYLLTCFATLTNLFQFNGFCKFSSKGQMSLKENIMKTFFKLYFFLFYHEMLSCNLCSKHFVCVRENTTTFWFSSLVTQIKNTKISLILFEILNTNNETYFLLKIYHPKQFQKIVLFQLMLLEQSEKPKL